MPAKRFSVEQIVAKLAPAAVAAAERASARLLRAAAARLAKR